MQPNVNFRSNVYVHAEGELEDDLAFITQVRERRALLKLCSIAPRVRAQLSRRQIAEIQWGQRCLQCGAIPEGVVIRNGKEVVTFHCPLRTCPIQLTRTRTIRVERSLIDRVTRKFGMPISECAIQALENRQSTDNTNGDGDGPLLPTQVSLPLSLFYFYTDLEIVAALRATLE